MGGKIGIAGPMSGPLRAYGVQRERLAAAQLGLPGQTLELVIVDDEANERARATPNQNCPLRPSVDNSSPITKRLTREDRQAESSKRALVTRMASRSSPAAGATPWSSTYRASCHGGCWL